MKISNHVAITWASLVSLIAMAVWTGFHSQTPFAALATAIVSLAGVSHVNNIISNYTSNSQPVVSQNPTNISVP